MIAALPMYDWPEARADTDAFWSAWRDALRAEGIAAPAALTRDRSRAALWRDPRLLASQTCGWPWATRFHDSLSLIAAPVYRCEGCEAGTYSSAVVVRADAPAETLAALRGARVAYNGLDSQSGAHALREAAAPLAEGAPFFSTGVETGSHRASMAALREGRADCAAIDAVCWALAARYAPRERDGLRVLCWTRPAPALPFVTSASGGADREALLRTLRRAVSEAGAPLLLADAAPPDPAACFDLPRRVSGVPPLFG